MRYGAGLAAMIMISGPASWRLFKDWHHSHSLALAALLVFAAFVVSYLSYKWVAAGEASR